jgi:uncharacterized protein
MFALSRRVQVRRHPLDDLGRVEIRINGVHLTDIGLDFQRCEVTEDLEAISMVTLQLNNDSRQAALSGQMSYWSDDRRFDVGNQLEVRMGYEYTHPVFMGEITGLEAEFSLEDGLTCVVRGHDLRHRLLRGRKTRSFQKMKDSAIVQQVASGAGLAVKVQDTEVIHDYVMQHNQTDLEFLQSRAQRIGYEVWVSHKTLYFQPFQHDKSHSLSLSFDRGELLEFSPHLSSLSQVAQVKVRGWDVKQKQVVVAQGSEPGSMMGGKISGVSAVKKAFGTSKQVIVDRPVKTSEEAKQMAQGQAKQLALDYVVGEGRCRGQTSLQSGQVIEIEGVGKRFSGLYYVVSVTHIVTNTEGYLTEFSVRRTAT